MISSRIATLPQADEGTDFTPVPSFPRSFPAFKQSSSLTPLVCDQQVILRLLEVILSRSGLTVSEISRRMGCSPNSVRQYLVGRRSKPSLLWFTKFAQLCGARINIEFP